ncbi:hypothetical protein F2Q70_00004741 [Brassica cretica]|uniref:Uncharacterized protein n=1 Tax=Brassica cretica TaxID=69181 RepID=A0A8S9ILI4_BRACR|nr:hypothetical protein F2Q70_00004741 [Brassica cretica]
MEIVGVNFGSHNLAIEGEGYGSQLRNAQSDMTTDDLNNGQTRNNGDDVNTPAGNVSAVNADANTAAFEEYKKMISTFEKKSEEPVRISSRLNDPCRTPERHTDFLPPLEEVAEEDEVERVDLDPNDQSDNSEDDADVHPIRTRSRTAQEDPLFDKPMTEEKENIFGAEHEKLAEEQARVTRSKR